MTLIAASLPIAGGVSIEDESILWYSLADPEGDEAVPCQWFANGGVGAGPNATDFATPCDIVGFEMGNTDEDLIVRWNLATTDIGGLATQDGAVTYQNLFRGNLPDVANFNVQFKLTPDGLELVDSPDGWESAIEHDIQGDSIVYSIPLSLLASEMAGGKVEPFLSNLTVQGATVNAWVLADNTALFPFRCTECDSLDNLGGNRLYVFQPYGGLTTPSLPESLVMHDVVGDELQVEETIEVGMPSTSDPYAARPVSGLYVYNWTMGLDGFQVALQVEEAVQGSVALEVTSPGGDPVVTEGLELVDGAGELYEVRRAVGSGTWNLTVYLDRFEGTFSLYAADAPLEGENGGGPAPGQNGGSEEEGEEGENNETGDPGGAEGGIPGPGAVFVLAALAALYVVRRRRSGAA